MSETRRARLRVEYDSVDISASIAPFVVSASFVDNAHGKADSLSIVLEDREGLWKGAWRPAKGATLRAWIDCQDWYAQGRGATLFCGTFEVDRLSFSTSSSGDRFTLGGVSAKVRNSLRREKTSRSWENTSIRQVFGDIAKYAGMEIIFEAADAALDRADQTNESDLGFLKRLADRLGMNLKVAESSLILFEGVAFDSRPPVMTVRRGDAILSSVRLSEEATDIYRACTVSYHDPATKQDYTYTFVPDDAPETGQTYRVNRRVKSLAEAQKLAKDALRRKNKSGCTGSLSLMGDARIRGGCVIRLDGFGTFDGTMFVETATHSIDGEGGYFVDADIRKTLEY